MRLATGEGAAGQGPSVANAVLLPALVPLLAVYLLAVRGAALSLVLGCVVIVFTVLGVEEYVGGSSTAAVGLMASILMGAALIGVVAAVARAVSARRL